MSPTVRVLSHTKLALSPALPTSSIGVGPTRASSRGVTRDIAKMPRVSGMKARPDAIGPKPRTPSMYCTARKNMDS